MKPHWTTLLQRMGSRDKNPVTLCILMDFSIQLKAIRIGLSIIYLTCLRGHRSAVPNYDYFCPCGLFFILISSVDPDEMPNDAAFYLGIHCLSKYPFSSSIQRVFMYIKCACVYIGLTVLHAACNILHTCKSSMYFILVFCFGGGL